MRRMSWLVVILVAGCAKPLPPYWRPGTGVEGLQYSYNQNETHATSLGEIILLPNGMIYPGAGGRPIGRNPKLWLDIVDAVRRFEGVGAYDINDGCWSHFTSYNLRLWVDNHWITAAFDGCARYGDKASDEVLGLLNRYLQSRVR